MEGLHLYRVHTTFNAAYDTIIEAPDQETAQKMFDAWRGSDDCPLFDRMLEYADFDQRDFPASRVQNEKQIRNWINVDLKWEDGNENV